jgi:hypothetical protein
MTLLLYSSEFNAPSKLDLVVPEMGTQGDSGMIPLIIYEALSAVYLTIGVLLISFSELPLLLFSASVFYFVGAAIWIMRSAYRRTDKFSVPQKRWILPDLFYEFKPFLHILTGTVLIRYSSGSITVAGFCLVLLAVKHLSQRQANRKCTSHLFA